MSRVSAFSLSLPHQANQGISASLCNASASGSDAHLVLSQNSSSGSEGACNMAHLMLSSSSSSSSSHRDRGHWRRAHRAPNGQREPIFPPLLEDRHLRGVLPLNPFFVGVLQVIHRFFDAPEAPDLARLIRNTLEDSSVTELLREFCV